MRGEIKSHTSPVSVSDLLRAVFHFLHRLGGEIINIICLKNAYLVQKGGKRWSGMNSQAAKQWESVSGFVRVANFDPREQAFSVE
mmetsp:Transcript_4149/g.7985  ORF Transcript_4149/g.7985 Transcript_4149/m.7985 type:complete len:85 (-) Transcript_4149:63-317(-)